MKTKTTTAVCKMHQNSPYRLQLAIVIAVLLLLINSFGMTVLGQTLFPNDPRITVVSAGDLTYWVGDPSLEPQVQFLNLRAAWAITSGNPSVKVAIISNGIDWNQPDMPTNNMLGYNFLDNNNNTSAVCLDPVFNVFCSDGTEASSVIFSKTNNLTGMFGIAGGWDGNAGVTPIVYKVFNYSCGTHNGYNDDGNAIARILSSINDAIQKGAKVILLPHTIGFVSEQNKQIFYNAINTILSDPCSQVSFIAAAGDKLVSEPSDIKFPGTCDQVITVGGVNSDHEMVFATPNTQMSCYGQYLDFVTGWSSPINMGNPCVKAPGQPNYIDPYYFKRSTMVSAAQLAGVVALMYSVNPNLHQNEVFEILKQSCFKTDNYTFNSNGWSEYVGYGFPNAKIALELAMDDQGEGIVISDTRTWPSTTVPSNYITGNITIKYGGKLTLNAMNLGITTGKSIIIETGGKLIANNSIITNACPNKPWKGIQVWGDKSENQLPDANGNYKQGYLELTGSTGSTIENAICAVDLWKPNDYSKTGGILKATNSTFRNNTCSIHALHYRNSHPTHPSYELDYNGMAVNCTFEITSNYIPENTFFKHVDLANIRGFSFNGCDFTLAPNVVGVSEWNSAIAAYSAGFKVQAICTSNNTVPCSSYDKCKFTGFRNGIIAENAGFSPNTFYVNRTEFENNVFGINVLGINNETVLNSDFKVRDNNTSGCSVTSGYGMYLDNSTGFAIEENEFTKMPNSPVANYTGIYIENTGGVDDIYKNSFTGLSFANSAYLKNYSGDEANNGLEYLCNTNIDNWADFFIPLKKDNGNGIQSFQGNNIISAGNTFSQSNNRWHFYNGGGYGLTYHYNGNAPYDPDPNNDKYEVFNVSRSVSNTANQCLSHYGGNGNAISIVLSDQDKMLREQQYAYNMANYNNVKALHDNLKDGGSTEARIIDIETALPQDMWALKTELLGVSPHLTDEVLKKVADKTDVFAESVIFDILAANPDELKKEELLQYLENKENPLPDYMIEILRQVADGETYRTVLEKQMSLYHKEMTRAANDMIRSYLNDTVTDYNALRSWLDNLGGLSADKQIISTYLHEENFIDAFALAEMLPNLYNLTGEALIEHESYMQVLTLYQTLHTENRQLNELTQSETEMLYDYANNSFGSTGAAAKGILTTYYNAQFVDCMEDMQNDSYKKGAVSPTDMAKIYGMEISVKPNPASDWAAFDFILPENEETATLQITDIAGKIIEVLTLSGKQGQHLWDTRHIKAGVYLYTLKSGTKSLGGKLTVIK